MKVSSPFDFILIALLLVWPESRVSADAKEAPDLAGLQSAAVAGDPEAAYELGRLHFLGREVPRDDAKALLYLQPSAEAGHAKAQGIYGFMLAQGRGVPKDEKSGLEWLRKAADQDEPVAQLNAGMMLVKGIGSTADLQAGLELIEKAAEAKNVDAQRALAEFYYFGGHGVERDHATALRWAMRAADQGNSWAQNLSGNMLEWGQGTPIELSKARQQYQNAAERGYLKAMASLGLMMLNGQGGAVDRVGAYYWLNLAARQGESSARNALPALVDGLSASEQAEGKRRLSEAGAAPARLPSIVP